MKTAKLRPRAQAKATLDWWRYSFTSAERRSRVLTRSASSPSFQNKRSPDCGIQVQITDGFPCSSSQSPLLARFQSAAWDLQYFCNVSSTFAQSLIRET